MENKIGVYVLGNSQTPSRFWSYSLVTDLAIVGNQSDYVFNTYKFDQKNTDLYNSLPDEEKKRITFRFINGTESKRYGKE